MPLSLNQEDIAAITEALKPIITEISSESAHAAVTKRNKSFEDKILSTVEQKFQKPQPQEVEEDEPQRLTIKTLQEKFESDNRKLREELKAEKEASSRKNMRSSLESQLLQEGVPANMLKAVASQLIHEDKLVDIDKDGNAVFKVPGYNNEVMPLSDGVSEFLKTEGKHFIPAPTAKGAGIKTQKSSSQTSLNPDADIEEKSRFWLNKIRSL